MMVDKQEIPALLFSIFEKDEIILIVLSESHLSASTKISLRPLLIKGKSFYQLTENKDQKAFHQNLSKEECFKWLGEQIENFKQTFIYTHSFDYHFLTSKKGKITLLKKPPTKTLKNLSHNRQKDYLLKEGQPIPFLIHLGIMNKEGKIYPAKQDKFRQINRYLEMIDDILPHLNQASPIHIVDFGCGKAYLTFALHHFLKVTKGLALNLIGLDLKSDVIQTCQQLAEDLGYEQDLQFLKEDINTFNSKQPIDLVVSLHACDTATDAALEKAIRWQSKVILCVPCCQHELYTQVKQDSLKTLLKHGILKERFAALATDAVRAELLETLGYQTQILEFIDLEHTPKNLLIRAVKKSQSKENQKAHYQTYLNFKKELNIHHSLEKRFQIELKQIGV